jgi:hypothetical protein
VNFAFDPTAVVASEEPGLIIGIDPGVPHPPAQDVILARQPKGLHVLGPGVQRRFDFLKSVWRQCFIGIDLQNPFVPALWSGPILLLRRIDVFVLNNPGSVLLANLQRSVSAKGINDQDLVGPLY